MIRNLSKQVLACFLSVCLVAPGYAVARSNIFPASSVLHKQIDEEALAPGAVGGLFRRTFSKALTLTILALMLNGVAMRAPAQNVQKNGAGTAIIEATPEQLLNQAKEARTYEQSLDLLRKLVSRYPEAAAKLHAWEDLSKLEGLDDPEKGLQVYQDYLRHMNIISPDDYSWPHLFVVLNFYLQMGNLQAAERLAVNGLERPPSSEMLNAKSVLTLDLSNIYLQEGKYEEAREVDKKPDEKAALAAWLKLPQSRTVHFSGSAPGIYGVAGDLTDKPARNEPVWIYVNPKARHSPIRGLAQATSKKNAAYFTDWVTDINFAYRYLTNGQFDLAPPEVHFEPLHSPRGKIENDIDLLTSPEVLEHMGRGGLVMLAGYGAAQEGVWLGHGVFRFNWEDPNTLKRAMIHEMGHGFGMEHMINIPTGYQFANTYRNYLHGTHTPQPDPKTGMVEQTLGFPPWIWNLFKRKYGWEPVPAVPILMNRTLEQSLLAAPSNRPATNPRPSKPLRNAIKMNRKLALSA
jgi:tetratricopeptide (TPR) repeat protein